MNTTNTNTGAKPTTTAIAKVERLPDYIEKFEADFGAGRLQLLRDTLCKDLTLEEMGLFLEVATAKKLDPFSRQIHAMKRRSKVKKWVPNPNGSGGRQEEVWEDKLTIMTGIDGFRTLAERTGKYEGQGGPWWCGPDGIWVDVWLKKEKPSACKVEVFRSAWRAPLTAIALWDEYAQGGTNDNGSRWYVHIWNEKPTVMLAKCAEAIALRRAFPEELSGLYTTDEMRAAELEDTVRERMAELEARLRASTDVSPALLDAAARVNAAKALAASSEVVQRVPPAATAKATAPAPVAQDQSPPSTSTSDASVTTPPPSVEQPSAPSDGTPAPSAREPDAVMDPPADEPPPTADEELGPGVERRMQAQVDDPARAMGDMGDEAVTAPAPANGKKVSVTARLLEFRKVMLSCKTPTQVSATLESWTTAIAGMPARPRAIAEAYARARGAELTNTKANTADETLATQLNELAKE